MTGKEKALVLFLLSIPAAFTVANEYRNMKAEMEAEITAQAQRNVMAWFEDTWACRGFDIDHNGDKRCTLRQRK